MKKQPLSEEFKRMQKLAGIIKENTVKDLLNLIKTNQGELETKLDIKIDEDEGVFIDGGQDVGVQSGYSGFAFRYPENVDENFLSDGDYPPKPINIGGVDLMYITYNI